MTSPKTLSITDRATDRELRDRLARIRVLIVDRDQRTARIVQRILFSFGLRTITLSNNGEHALALLSEHTYDFLITEWHMHPFDGIELVKTIRKARGENQPPRDIPIIMMTSRTELESVQIARDAGVTEFIAKPFTPAAISGRIVQIIDNPRAFVETPGYSGPCRRRRGNPPPGVEDRRKPRDEAATPPNYALREQLGIASAANELLNELTIDTAYQALMEAEPVEWVRIELTQLKAAFAALTAAPENPATQTQVMAATHAIHTQAGAHHYALGQKISMLLLAYLQQHLPPRAKHLLVIGKHIEAMVVIFNQNVTQHSHSIARELIQSLSKLVAKLE